MSEPVERIPSFGAGASAFERIMGGASEVGRSRERSGSFESLLRSADGAAQSGDSLRLSPEAQEQLRKLRQRDAEVRAHEAAHLAAAGQYAAGGASYEYQQGPDGRQYAIGGHVDIDASSVPGDAEATERKAEQIRRAALAPGEPSAQDARVAAKAAQMSARAKADQGDETSGDSSDQSVTPGARVADRAMRAYGSVSGFFADAADSVGPAGILRGVQSFQASADASTQSWLGMARGLKAYAVASWQDAMASAVAPWGTGIAMEV